MDNLVSIVVPVYNAQNFITDTIISIREQTYENWELLLVEDGSTDDTLRIMTEYVNSLQDFRIHILNAPEKKGAAQARNKGIEEAKGRFLAYLDADDIWKPEKLQKELDFMKKRKAAFVFSGYEFADEEARGTGKIVRVPQTLTFREALSNTTIFTSTVLLDLKKLGKELVKMPAIKSEDTASWWKILKTGVTAYGLDENLVLYRRAGRSLSSNKLEAVRRIWNLYRQAAGLSVGRSCYHFVFWAIRAVKRRL